MKKAAVELDSFDRKLLTMLQRRGRASFVELGEAVSLSESACLRRVRALEEQGVISRYAAVIDERAVGLPLSVFVTVTLSSQAESALSAFEKAVTGVREVAEHLVFQGQTRSPRKHLTASGNKCLHHARATRLVSIHEHKHSIAKIQQRCPSRKTVVWASPASVHVCPAEGQERTRAGMHPSLVKPAGEADLTGPFAHDG